MCPRLFGDTHFVLMILLVPFHFQRIFLVYSKRLNLRFRVTYNAIQQANDQLLRKEIENCKTSVALLRRYAHRREAMKGKYCVCEVLTMFETPAYKFCRHFYESSERVNFLLSVSRVMACLWLVRIGPVYCLATKRCAHDRTY